MINNFVQQQNCYQFNIHGYKKDSTLEFLNINYTEEFCKTIIPSLFSPILIHSSDYGKGRRTDEKIEMNIPSFENRISGDLFYFNDHKFLNNFQPYFTKYTSDKNCYFGLSMSYPQGTSGLNQNEVLLSSLKDTNQIEKKIFSFDKFILNKDTINTRFYFGQDHQDFTLNDGIIGTCKINEEDIFWGCSFDEMIINNKSISLTRTNDNKLYKIYLSTENYNIIFPINLINDTYINGLLFDNKCEYNAFNGYVECTNLFNGEEYIPLQLRSKDINITLELDKFNRYYSSNNNDNEKININLSDDINYIIFPLIMFKQFHVQFDAEKKVINFYTKNSSLLQVKKEDHEASKNEEGSSSGLTTFLVILIILIIIGIGFGVFYFLRKRKNKVEKDINRFTKFEDEEDFKNMNENKVY